METIVKRITKVVTKFEEDTFKDYIAISSDSILIIDKNLELVEWIIQGIDLDAVYLSVKNEDDFLDAILFFKNAISLGQNPIDLV